MAKKRIAIAGGGAAGFFAAIACAQADQKSSVTIYEKGSEFLTKVRISGGGRCNVTHACFEAREFAARYPRGGRALLSPLHRFDARDAVEWFESRGVKLKTEADGRMFPVSDSSASIVDCLVAEAEKARVQLLIRRGITSAARRDGGGFQLTLDSGEREICDCLCLATGGCRNPAGADLARSLGHEIEPPVPSLFTFHVDAEWLRKLPGVSVESVEVTIPGTRLRERGPLLITHSGVSGPAILRLSAWGARELHAMDYRFGLRVNWLPDLNAEQVAAELNARRRSSAARLIANVPLGALPARLWESLLHLCGVAGAARWSALSRDAATKLSTLLQRTELPVTGKSLNKDEFVTCGGVRLREVDLKTMQSRICPGLYFAGELLDIDGITGGFNFQAAWTTGFIAGNAMAIS